MRATKTKKNLLCYVNGKILPEHKAKVPVQERGFLYGDGCFEGIGVLEGRVIQLDEHINRLYESAKALNIVIPLSKEELKTEFLRLLKENNTKEIGYLRIVVTRGVGLGVEKTVRIQKPTIVIIPLIREWLGMAKMKAGEGIKVTIASLRRVPPECLDPRIKSLNYLNVILAKIDAANSGADDAIMLDIRGFVSEATAENVFVVKNGKIYTPTITHTLEGITRNTIIDTAKNAGYEVHEVNLTPYDLYVADEVFLTGSITGVVSVCQVNGRIIGDGEPGLVAKKLLTLWLDTIKKTSETW